MVVLLLKVWFIRAILFHCYCISGLRQIITARRLFWKC